MLGALRPTFSRWRTVSVNLVVESKPDGSSPKKKKFWKIVLIPIGVFIAPRSNPRVPVGGPGAPHGLSGRVCCAVRSSCTSIGHQGGFLPVGVVCGTDCRRCSHARAPGRRLPQTCPCVRSGRVLVPSTHSLHRAPLSHDTVIRRGNRHPGGTDVESALVLTGSPVTSGTATVRVEGWQAQPSSRPSRHLLEVGNHRARGFVSQALAPACLPPVWVLGRAGGGGGRLLRLRRESFGETYSNLEVQPLSAGT